MTTLEETLSYFKKKQDEIIGLHGEYAQKKEALEKEIETFVENKKRELNPLESKLNEATAKYKAEMKSQFGIADGENANVLQLVEAIIAVGKMK